LRHYDSSQKITQADIENLKACFGIETEDISLEVIARTVVQRELDREKARSQSIERIEVRTQVVNIKILVSWQVLALAYPEY